MSHNWTKGDFLKAFEQWSKENQDPRISDWIAKLSAPNQGKLYDAYVLDIYRRLHEIQEPAKQWYRDLVEYLGFPWESMHPISREPWFLSALQRVAILIERIELHGQTLTGTYRTWVKSPDRRFQFSEPPFTNTTGWTDEQVKDRLDTILKRIEFQQAGLPAQEWWRQWSMQSGRRNTEILKRAEEILSRQGTLAQAHRHFQGNGCGDWKRTLLLLNADKEQTNWETQCKSNHQALDARWESLLALSDREDQVELDELSDTQIHEEFERLSRQIGWPEVMPEESICIDSPAHAPSNKEVDDNGEADDSRLAQTWNQLWENACNSDVGRHGIIRLVECLERHDVRFDAFLRYGATETATTVLGQVYRTILKRPKRNTRLTVEYGTDATGQFADLTAVATPTGQRTWQRMRWIFPGTFIMGSPKGEDGRYDDEVQHQVTITEGFWMFDTPCTQGFWELMTGRNPSYFSDPQRPVEQVSWNDVQEFTHELNDRISNESWGRFRLPTEAEWEYACRASTSEATYAGDLKIFGDANAPILDPIGWYGGNSGRNYDLEKSSSLERDWLKDRQYPDKFGGTRKVATKTPNPWGLYDMLGNVWEWCEDWYGQYTDDRATDPIGPSTGADRVLRGGSWHSPARRLRSAGRFRVAPGLRDGSLGFRLLSSAHQAKPTESVADASRSEQREEAEGRGR
jgi:formylglycine-generating enzyme required for sulfatase activity